LWLLPLLLLLVATAILSVPVGLYLAWIVDGHARPPRWLRWIEARLDTGKQNWKEYAVTLLLFNTVLFVAGYVVLALQPWLPLNPDHKGMLAPTTIFNTVISFQSNTSLQHYAGEQCLSYFSQLTAILWNMFLGGATGLCALAAVIRGLRGDAHLGNYYLDAWRLLVYAILPISVIFAVLFLAAGVPMTFRGAETITHLADGQSPPQVMARGPVAVMMPVKHLASVGGGWFGANSAHPFEDPTAWTSFLSCLAILLLPAASLVQFGKMLKAPRHAVVLASVMVTLFVAMIGWAVYWDTMQPNPALVARPGLRLEWDDAAEPL
jgi:K+-transporting ATPase ATPase A chain